MSIEQLTERNPFKGSCDAIIKHCKKATGQNLDKIAKQKLDHELAAEFLKLTEEVTKDQALIVPSEVVNVACSVQTKEAVAFLAAYGDRKPPETEKKKASAKDDGPGEEKPAASRRERKNEGRVVQFGKAPYLNDKENEESPFLTTVDKDGKENTIWGKDLERAVTEADVQIGDYLEAENLGRQPVTVKVKKKDEQGNWHTKEIQTHRNTWNVRLLRRGQAVTQSTPPPAKPKFDPCQMSRGGDIAPQSRCR